MTTEKRGPSPEAVRKAVAQFQQELTAAAPAIGHIMSQPLPGEDCLDRELGVLSTCEGPVEYRMPLSATGRSFPRCEKHWGERLDDQEEMNRRYPAQAPLDFDPTYAGESWDED